MQPEYCSIDFSISVPMLPWAHECYVQEITGAIINDAKIGEIKLLKIHVAKAMNDRMDLLDICDAHSGYLESLYHAVFNGKGETRPELEIEPSWDDVLVLWEFEIPTELRHAGVVVQAFETAITAFGATDLVVAAINGEQYDFIGLDLTVDEWRRLGFKRIAGSQFAFRDNGCLNPYHVADS